MLIFQFYGARSHPGTTTDRVGGSQEPAVQIYLRQHAQGRHVVHQFRFDNLNDTIVRLLYIYLYIYIFFLFSLREAYLILAIYASTCVCVSFLNFFAENKYCRACGRRTESW